MGCLLYLGMMRMESKWYRFNKGVVTVNLVDVACVCRRRTMLKDLDSFWKNFDEVLELCHKAALPL